VNRNVPISLNGIFIFAFVIMILIYKIPPTVDFLWLDEAHGPSILDIVFLNVWDFF